MALEVVFKKDKKAGATLINKIILMLVKQLQNIHHFTINVWYKLSKYGWFPVLFVYQNYVPSTHRV